MVTHYNIGQVLFAFKGEWSEATAYAALDCVTYEGGTYVCKKDAPAGTAPTNTEYWFVMAQKGKHFFRDCLSGSYRIGRYRQGCRAEKTGCHVPDAQYERNVCRPPSKRCRKTDSHCRGYLGDLHLRGFHRECSLCPGRLLFSADSEGQERLIIVSGLVPVLE